MLLVLLLRAEVLLLHCAAAAAAVTPAAAAALLSTRIQLKAVEVLLSLLLPPLLPVASIRCMPQPAAAACRTDIHPQLLLQVLLLIRQALHRAAAYQPYRHPVAAYTA